MQFNYAVLLRHILERKQVAAAAAVEKRVLLSIVSRYFIYGPYEDNSSSSYVDDAILIHHEPDNFYLRNLQNIYKY